MSRHCRGCGRRNARRSRTVFGQVSFWLYLSLVIALLWVYAEIGGGAG